MAQVLARLEALEDERQIVETLHRYGHAVDYGPPEAWADLFTNAGVRTLFRANGQTVSQRGRAEFIAHLSKVPLPKGTWDKHVTSNPVITLHGRTAKAESYFIQFNSRSEGGPRVNAFGRYHDTLVKERGRWRIKERLAEVNASLSS